MTRTASAASPAGDTTTWCAPTTWAALAAVLAARLLYLARYGWDIGWMNLGYLDHARQLALGRGQASEEQPLAFLALDRGAPAGAERAWCQRGRLSRRRTCCWRGRRRHRALRVARWRRAGGGRLRRDAGCSCRCSRRSRGATTWGSALAAGLSAARLARRRPRRRVRGRWAQGVSAMAGTLAALAARRGTRRW